MSAPRTPVAESLASAARHLQYALEQSATLDEAFQKLYSTTDQRRRETIHQLELLLRSPESGQAAGRSTRLSSYPTLAWLLRQTAAPEKAAAALFREYRRHESFSATTVVAVWSEFAGFLTYLGAVLAVLIVVAGMYGSFVMPQFRSLYSGFGSELPALTRGVFGGGAPVFALALIVAVGFLGFLSWFVFILRRQLRRYVPLSARYQRIPLVGPVAVAYHQYLWLSYAGMLRATGMEAGEALRVAATRVPQLHLANSDVPGAPPEWTSVASASAVATDLATAAKLGKLADETQYQQEATVDSFLSALARCRRRSRIILTICVYFLAATFVSAMYLPIFSLGSAL